MTRCLDALAALESVLVEALRLTRVPLPADLAQVEAVWKGAPARLEARAYRGEGLAWARFVTLEAGEALAVGNALVVGRPRAGLPVFGADLVSVAGPRGGLLAADLSPERPEATVAPPIAAAQEEARAALGAAAPAGPLPAWCAPFFSPGALFVRVEDDWTEAEAACLALARGFFGHARQRAGEALRAADVTAARAHVAAYLRAHRQDDAGPGLLRKVFGPDLGDRLVTEVLFPDLPFASPEPAAATEVVGV